MKRYYIKRSGGLVFWRLGRLGGSFYFARRRRARSQTWLTRRSASGYPFIVRINTPIDLVRHRARQ